jgi:hypothetical protein
MKKNLFYSNDEVYSIIHENLNAMNSPGSENAIVRPDTISVYTHTHTEIIYFHSWLSMSLVINLCSQI